MKINEHFANGDATFRALENLMGELDRNGDSKFTVDDLYLLLYYYGGSEDSARGAPTGLRCARLGEKCAIPGGRTAALTPCCAPAACRAERGLSKRCNRPEDSVLSDLVL